ncbi:MAG: quinolinate synthase NadA [Lachnospiraceae bacterium]|nr:quinolinate synthase NadA [Lachnospiraceae bacterium]
MYNTKDLQETIIQLKKEKDVCILAHAYQTQDILEVADFIGDSFGLSQQAQTVPQQNLLMCGVRFMAETAKILSPDKKVILSHPDAGCPMAEQLTVEELKEIKTRYPNAAVVAYINTTSELKTECDVCVTSASALNIVKNLPNEEILFIPDCNLGSWIEKQVPEKKFHFIKGGCPVHMRITPEDVSKARTAHPDAPVLVHPECKKEVTALADYAGSTTGIMKFAANSECKEFIIGTDTSIVQHLQFEHPDKKFYALSKDCICHDMKLTTLMDVYNCLIGEAGEEITLSDETREKAKKCIDAMLEMS